MRILYINANVYDFLTAAIIEGINELSQEMRLDLVCTQHANYSRRLQVWPRERVRRSRGLFDLVILGTNVGVDVELFRDLACSNRAICIDGADTSEFEYPPGQFCLYFKRELMVAPSSNILPCPFAVERRWLYPISRRTKYFLTACFGPSTPARATLLRFLESLNLPNARIGSVGQSRLQKLAGVFRGQCTLNTARKYGFAVGHNGKYYKTLRASSLALAPHGDGEDTGRWWEILGCGSLLVAPESRLHMPFPFVSGEHYLSYASVAELGEKLLWARASPAEVERIRLAGRSHVLRHHTTKERARYVLETFMQRNAPRDEALATPSS
jgi:hypothetical protein